VAGTGGEPETDRQTKGRDAQAEGAVAPPRTLAPDAEGGEADEAAPA
jgi:hypothetical protein